jgi:hypothetical protein
MKVMPAAINVAAIRSIDPALMACPASKRRTVATPTWPRSASYCAVQPHTVDEKIRGDDWPDVLLARWSNEAMKTPGWLQKPLAADFIAYAPAPAATCVLLPVPALQRAWRQHGRQWIGLYGQKRAQNEGYTTVSVPVPRGVLMQAIVEAMFVSRRSRETLSRLPQSGSSRSPLRLKTGTSPNLRRLSCASSERLYVSTRRQCEAARRLAPY